MLNSFGLSAQTPVIDTYEVTGSDIDALIASLNKNGSAGGLGRTNHRWSLSYTLSEKNGRHTVSEVLVEHSVSIDMPTWADYRNAPPCLQSSWDAMYLNLQKHENKHVELGKGVSEKLEHGLLSIPAQSSREALNKIVKVTVAEIHRENRAVQSKFDSETDHGRDAGNNTVVLEEC